VGNPSEWYKAIALADKVRTRHRCLHISIDIIVDMMVKLGRKAAATGIKNTRVNCIGFKYDSKQLNIWISGEFTESNGQKI
jgi:hypothetical protein